MKWYVAVDDSGGEGVQAQHPADRAVIVGPLLPGQAGEVGADEDLLQELGRHRAAGHGAMDTPDRLHVGPGRTFVFVPGLGGHSLRDYHWAQHADDTWWATVYTRNSYLRAGTTVAKSCARCTRVVPGYTFGGLFITFNVGGDPNTAEAYFKTVTGETIETFSIVKHKPGMPRDGGG